METPLKLKVLESLSKSRQNFSGSDAKFATSLGISSAQYSRIKNGEIEKVISDANWISIARRLGVELRATIEWVTAHTPVYEYIYGQLTYCQENSSSGLLCDLSDIGKSHIAKLYSIQNSNVAYVDCSQVKKKNQLVREIAKRYGVGSTGRYADVYEDLVFYLGSLPNPLIILDEAGDITYEAFLELKALWNATEKRCGWYMMGADGLENKIKLGIEYKKVGYPEIFSRYGSRYQKVSPDAGKEIEEFKTVQAALVIKANIELLSSDVRSMILRTGGSLRRIKDKIIKIKSKQCPEPIQ